MACRIRKRRRLRPAQADEVVPETIGRFRVRDCLGKGGFGAVYLAHDPDLDRLAALKVPRPGRFHSDEEREQFHGGGEDGSKAGTPWHRYRP